jgi:hypothetical protein
MKQNISKVNRKQIEIEDLVISNPKTGVISSIGTAKVRGSYQAKIRRLV